jgi:hypothetical protein
MHFHGVGRHYSQASMHLSSNGEESKTSREAQLTRSKRGRCRREIDRFYKEVAFKERNLVYAVASHAEGGRALNCCVIIE